MRTDLEVADVVEGIEIESMVTKPVRGVTEDGKTIEEDNLQLKLRNNGKGVFTFIDCNLEYLDIDGSNLGFDSDGTFSDLKPNNSCLISIPMIVPRNTKSKKLVITGESKHVYQKYMSWFQMSLIVALLVFIVYERFFE